MTQNIYAASWTHYRTRYQNRCHSVDTIYLDFAKAFDIVLHERLLEKAKGYGIRGDILEWIRLFIII